MVRKRGSPSGVLRELEASTCERAGDGVVNMVIYRLDMSSEGKDADQNQEKALHDEKAGEVVSLGLVKSRR